MRRGIIFIVALLSLFSCGREYKEVMDTAEAQMMQDPDSALALMQSIVAEDLPTRGQRARHALLLTMAKDKCYQDISGDTTIRMSYEWYQHHGSKRYKMLSAYYLGFVEQSRGKNIEAALAFREAEPLAEELEDYRQLSLVEQHLSAIFAANYDHVRALEYAEHSLEAANKAGEESMADYCKYDVAVQLLAKFRYEDAELIIDELLLKKNNLSRSFYRTIASLKARILLFETPADYLGAKSIFDSLLSIQAISFTSTDYGRMALVEEMCGNSERADSYLKESFHLVSTKIDSLGYFNDCYNVFDQRGDKDRALAFLSKRVDLQDEIVIDLLGQSETHALESHYKNKWELELAQSRARMYLFGLISFVILVIISIVVYFFSKRSRAVLEDMARAQDLSNDLMNTLVADKIKSLQGLSESYFSWEDASVRKREERMGKQTRDEIITTFRTQLNDLRNDKSFISTLEQSLNLTNNGIMDRIHKCLPSEKELDYSILTLLFSGFTIKSISFLLRMSEPSLRMRKTRYKHLFESLPEPDRSVFLNNLG